MELVAPSPSTTVSMQAKLDQLEAAIKEAHEVVDAIAPRESAEGTAIDVAMGAEACLDRCQGQVQDLISRFSHVRDRVGHL